MTPADPTIAAAIAAAPTPDTTRIEGRDGHPITLADGRAWLFARPTLRLAPRFDADGTAAVDTVWGYPPHLRARLDRLALASRAEAGGVPLGPVFELAVALVRHCHDLTAAEACALFELGMADFDVLVTEITTLIRTPPPWAETAAPEPTP